MTQHDSPNEIHVASSVPGTLRGVGEAILLGMIVFSPWPFGSTTAVFELALTFGLMLLTALAIAASAWGHRGLLRIDAPGACLIGLAAWTALQIVPLPESFVGLISPTRLEWHRTLVPLELEQLSDEEPRTTRPTWLPLSVDPASTRHHLTEFLGVAIIYLLVRNWIANTRAFVRLAWVLAAVGTALALMAIGQSLTSPSNRVYGIPVGGTVFGPFICKNHFPDFVVPCLGLSLGLLFRSGGYHYERSTRGEGLLAWLITPTSLLLLSAIGLMMVSIAFSLSRGGLIAAASALLVSLPLLGRQPTLRHRRSVLLGGVAIGILIASGLGSWFGLRTVEQRVASIGTQEAVDSRLPIWRDSVGLIPSLWSVGSGGGTYITVEPLVRTDRAATDVVDSAHNEYLEAIIEGGIVRFALSLALPVTLLVAIARTAMKHPSHSMQALAGGAWLSLAAAAFHAIVDFGLHLPSVALVTVTVAGFATSRVPGAHHQTPRFSVRLLAAVVLAGLAGLIGWESRSNALAERWKAAADFTYWKDGQPDRLAERARYLDLRAASRPDDAAILFEAGQGHLDALADAARRRGLTGFDRLPDDLRERHLRPALVAWRAARSANPIAPKPHSRLGLFADAWAKSEPANVHFDRAKRLLPRDANLWFTSGKEAFRHGDFPRALADWRQALTLDAGQLDAVLSRAGQQWSPAEMLRDLFPHEPALLWAAANRLFPDVARDIDRRRPFLVAAIQASRPDHTGPQFAAVALAFEECEQIPEAIVAWRTAVARSPDEARFRDLFSRMLDREERYDEAIPHLEWLRKRRPDPSIKDRIDRAEHGVRLQKALRTGSPR